jgi:putative ABC transport system permease protein
LYGLLSYIVTHRTFEIGLRMAIGAQREDVLRMILYRGLKLAALGLTAGLCASAMLTAFLAHMLYGVKPLDPVAFSAVVLVLLAVSALASFAPAWRASRLEPVKTLRDQ